MLGFFLRDFISHHEQKFSQQVNNSGIKSFLTIAGDIMDGPVKVTQGQQSSIVHRRNVDLLKSLRHLRHYGRQYSRRRSGSNAEASASHGGNTPSYDEKWSLKMASKCSTDSGHHTGALYVLYLKTCSFNRNLIQNCSDSWLNSVLGLALRLITLLFLELWLQ